MNTNIRVVLIVLSVLLIGYFFGTRFVTGERGPRQKKSLSVLLGGDIYVGDRVKSVIRSKSAQYMVRDLIDLTSGADLHLANLEAPITARDNSPFKKRYVFGTDPESTLSILNALNVHGVSLANNHILDHGIDGLLDTVEHLRESGVKFAGVGANAENATRPAVFKIGTQKVGFLAFSNTYPDSYWAGTDRPGTAYGRLETVEKSVQTLSSRVDRTIVSMHWGSQSSTQPQRYQRDLAHGAIESGADVVFGHHPHVIQPVERYEDGIIFYSLGNYFFTTLSNKVEYGLLANVKFSTENSDEVSVSYHVIHVNNYKVNYRPRLVEQFEDGRDLANFLERDKLFTIVGKFDGNRSELR